MDPEVAYRELNQFFDGLAAYEYEGPSLATLNGIADYWFALDEWFRKGGSLPLSWRNAGQDKR